MGDERVRILLQAGVLGSYSAVLSRQQQVAQASLATFGQSPAVLFETSDMFPAKDSLADYVKTIQGMQNQMQDLVNRLGVWSDGFARAPQAYQHADAMGQRALLDSIGELD